MARPHIVRMVSWALATVLVVSLPAGWLLTEPVRADEPEKIDSSLKFIPEDAAFYGSMLRNREQIEIIAQSKAWANLMALPAVQDGLKLLEAQTADPNSVGGKVQTALESPQVKTLLALAADMFSHDVFVYGDQGVVDVLELFSQLSNTASYGPMVLKASGKADELDPEQQRAVLVLQSLADHLEIINVPNIIVGFKLKDTQRAEQQLEKLKEMLDILLLSVPQLNGRFERTQVGEDEYLTVSLDGEMIPWDNLPLEELRKVESREGDADKVMAKLKELKLVIALGLRDDYLLLSIVDSTDRLAELGQGKLLVDRPEMKPLKKFADRRLAGIGYVSEDMASRLAFSPADVDKLLKLGESLLPAAELDAEMEAQIRKDAAVLAEDLKRMLPKPGARTSFSFITGQGIESYSYNWGGIGSLDGSKPLSLLEHVGGDPLLMVVARSKGSPGDYDTLVRWLKTGFRYFDHFATKEMGESDRKKYKQFVELVRPLAARLDKANREMLIPALADGQWALVVDAKLTSRQFCKEMLRTDEPMPMVEPALVVGVSDAELLRKACVEYREVFDAVVEAIREVDPKAIPDDYKIPWPKVTETSAGTICFYRLPKEWGVDKQISPGAGLSDEVAVVSSSRKHAGRLLKATPLEVGGLLTDPDRPLAVAFSLNWAALVDAAAPWVKLAAREIAKQGLQVESEEAKQAEIDSIVQQVQTVLEVLKVMRTVSSETYFEDNVWVSHSLVEIRDVE